MVKLRFYKHQIFKCIVAWSLFVLTVVPSSGLARVYIDITSPFLRKIPIAIPYPVENTGIFENKVLAKKVANALSNDLIFNGLFQVLDASQYGGKENVDWSRFKLDYLVKSKMARNGQRLTVEFRLFDLSNGKMIQGMRYKGKVKNYRIMAHRFCDIIVRAVTGEPGVSRSRIAFVKKVKGKKEIFSADFDGRHMQQETNDSNIALSPSFSPDGKYLAYTSYLTGRPHLYIKELATGKVKRLAGYSGLNIAPAWHPDSEKLAVTLSKDGNPDLYLIRLDGSIEARLTRGPGTCVSPSWSPDGTKIAFVSDRAGTPQIYVLDIYSGKVKRLTYEGSYNTDPAWSPKGDRIAYTGRVEGRFQIFTISPDGSDSIQLTFEGNNEYPSWSPDGRQILFTSTRLGPEKHIFRMFANGRAQQVLNRNLNNVSTPSWGPNVFF